MKIWQAIIMGGVLTLCFPTNGGNDDNARYLRLRRLAKETAADGETFDFYGFFPGMSRHDAQFLASYYSLDGNDCYVSVVGENAVHRLALKFKAVVKILKRFNQPRQTYEEVCQSVANVVGDLACMRKVGNFGQVSEWCERELIGGASLEIYKNSGAMIMDGCDETKSMKPIETDEAKKQRIENDERFVSDLLESMVEVPVEPKSRLRPFKLCKYEVSQIQWAHVMGGNPARWITSQVGSKNNGECPVEDVSWDDCQRFIAKLNAMPEVKASGLVFRLPTAAEWDYACRAGADRFGVNASCVCNGLDGVAITAENVCDIAWIRSKGCHDDGVDDEYWPRPVGLKAPNAFGLFDMIGNVSEWTLSPDGDHKSEYFFFGGSMSDYWAVEDRVSLRRGHMHSGGTSDHVGLRLCASKNGVINWGTGGSANTRDSTTKDGSNGGRTPPNTPITITEKDRAFGKRISALCSSSLDYSTAGKWFKLSKEVSSNELKQLILGASGSALISLGKLDVYDANVKPLLADGASFRKAFDTKCPKCAGARNVEEKCWTCSGRGGCSNKSCKGGQCFVNRMNGGSYWRACRDCKGSAKCVKCGGSGKRSAKCRRCNGKGSVMNREDAAKAYKHYVEAISAVFKKTKASS